METVGERPGRGRSVVAKEKRFRAGRSEAGKTRRQ